MVEWINFFEIFIWVSEKNKYVVGQVALKLKAATVTLLILVDSITIVYDSRQA